MSRRRGPRVGGPPARDLDDALNGADDSQPLFDPDYMRAEQAYARTIGHVVPNAHGNQVYTTHDLGALPDTVYDDYQEDAQ